MTLLDQIADDYQARFGEPEYRYFKKLISWTKFRRQPGYHFAPIGDGEEITREEYESNVEASKRAATDAFMGRLQASYWRYDRKMVKGGWREALTKDVQELQR